VHRVVLLLLLLLLPLAHVTRHSCVLQPLLLRSACGAAKQRQPLRHFSIASTWGRTVHLRDLWEPLQPHREHLPIRSKTEMSYLVNVGEGVSSSIPDYAFKVGSSSSSSSRDFVLRLIRIAATGQPKQRWLQLQGKISNPKPKTQNPKPKTQNPKPQTPNPKPQNPKPQFLTAPQGQTRPSSKQRVIKVIFNHKQYSTTNNNHHKS
jgi:hypothetical protein